MNTPFTFPNVPEFVAKAWTHVAGDDTPLMYATCPNFALVGVMKKGEKYTLYYVRIDALDCRTVILKDFSRLDDATYTFEGLQAESMVSHLFLLL